MTTDYLEIGSSPCEEPCVQVGGVGYGVLDRFECECFKEQLQRQFPNGRFGVRRQPHDFGSYFEIWAYFDPENQDELDAAFAAESKSWETWQPDIKERLVTYGMSKGFILTDRGWKRMLP